LHVISPLVFRATDLPWPAADGVAAHKIERGFNVMMCGATSWATGWCQTLPPAISRRSCQS
jgi:hypothetical protein